MALLTKISPEVIKGVIPNRNNYLGIGGLMPSTNFSSEGMLGLYQNVGWLHAVVFRIALGCSEVEWTLFDTTNQDKPKQIFKHPILTLLKLVNPFQTSNEFIALDTIYNELIGESFWALNFNALGEPAEIVLPYPNKMSVVPAANFPFVKGYVYGTGADAVPFDVNEIIHFKYPNPLNQYRGLAPARAIGINLDAEQNADKWVNQFFYNSARPDGVIQFDYNLSDEQFDKLKKQWSEKYKGVSKAHQVALLEGGGKYLQIQNTIKDMDFANLKQKNRDVILGVFGMPQSVMGISENVNKANAEAGDYTFARWIVKPRLDWKKAKIQEQLIPKFRKTENLQIGFKEVVPETAEQKRMDAESGLRAGYKTINDARKITGDDPLPPEIGDVLLIPLNLIPTPIKGKEIREEESYKGGEGSGNFGHEGRPGEAGGSGEGGGGVATHSNRINGIGYISDESEARDFRDSLDAEAENDSDLQNLLAGSDRWVAGEDWETMKNEADNYFKTGEAPEDTKALLKAVNGSSGSPTLYRGISVDGDVDSVISSYSEGKEFDLSLSSFTSDEAIANGYSNAWGKETKVTFQMREGGKGFYVAPTQPDFLENQEWITGGRFKVSSISQEGKHSVKVGIEQINTFEIKRLESSSFQDLPSNLKLHWGGLFPIGMKR